VESLRAEAGRLCEALGRIAGVSAGVCEDVAYVGSGSIPDEGIPTMVVRIRHAKLSADELAYRLRQGIPSVFGRLEDRELVIDLRTLGEGEAAEVVKAVERAVG
jgi:seryl-tRNA(Sec) selenium transferase